MDDFKEFQGKSLDEAIRNACTYFDSGREKLELDIIQDAKSGIFGLVGARKAIVKARRMQLRNPLQNVTTLQTGSEPTSAPQEESTSQPKGKAPRTRAKHEPPVQMPADKPAAEAAPTKAVKESCNEQNKEQGEQNAAPAREACTPKTSAKPKSPRRTPRAQQPVPLGEATQNILHDENLAEDMGDHIQATPLDELDQEKLQALTLDVVKTLVSSIVTTVELHVTIADNRVNVGVDCDEDSGLLIGREGQTLAALQYIASRIISKQMNAIVRVQLDAGEYRLRQDEKLRDMALMLAEKVRSTGKSYSTRPLSSYHRRIVHMTLQDAPDIQTRSTGDGALKRVVVQRKR